MSERRRGKSGRRGRWTRREFLKASVASAGFPYVLTSRALGGGGRLAASERIGMGFVGIGSQGGGHLCGGAWTYLPGGYLARPDAQVLAVCDVKRDARERALHRVNDYYAKSAGAGNYRACRGYVDFRELLARDDIDAVVLSLPVHWHAMMAVQALKAGKDVYCEKPTALTIGEAQAVRDAALRYGRVYQAGTQQRSEYGERFRLACELVRNGRIGKLQAVYTYIGGGGHNWQRSFGPGRPVLDDLDWDLWLGPWPWMAYDGNSAARRFGWGGFDWGQHHFDIAQWGCDGDRTGPTELSRQKGGVVMRYAGGVEVHCYRYPDPTIGVPGGRAFRAEGGCCFVGAEGKIAVDRTDLIANPPEILRKPLGPDDLRLYYSTSHSGNFLDCVRTRQRTICDAEAACRSASLLVLAGIAERLGRNLKWDPEAERFIDDDEANRMRSITYRPPWRLG